MKMKKSIQRIVIFVMIILASWCMNTHLIEEQQQVYAASDNQDNEISINTEEVTLYFVNDEYKDQVGEITDEYQTEFKLTVKGARNVTYDLINGEEYIHLSSDGVIKPNLVYNCRKDGVTSGFYYVFYHEPPEGYTIYDTYYVTGTGLVRVDADGKEFYVNVSTEDYAEYYADKLINEYIRTNIDDSMSMEEKLDAICKFVADRPYDYRYQSWIDAVYFGGDCWASSNLIVHMCNKIGIDAWSRNGNKDPLASSGHRNVIVDGQDGSYYICDAGYTGSAPRYYSIDKKTSLWDYQVNSDGEATIYQYNEKANEIGDVLVVPSEIDGYKVTGISNEYSTGSKNFKKIILPDTLTTIGARAFANMGLESITIPAKVTSIGEYAFWGNVNLKEFESESKDYPVMDGVLYNKDKTTLIFAPYIENITIPETVTTIEAFAFYQNMNIKKVTIPSTVKTIGAYSFADTSLSHIDIEEDGVTELPNYAFYYNYNLEQIRVPSTVEKLGSNVFLDYIEFTLFTEEASAAENYVLDNENITINHNLWQYNPDCETAGHQYQDMKLITEPTCTEAGEAEYTCYKCGNIKHEMVHPTGHNEVIDEGYEASCEQDGLTRGNHCSVCDNVIVAQEKIPAPGHQEVKDKAVEPTEISTGLTEGSHCGVCGAVMQEQLVIPQLILNKWVEKNNQWYYYDSNGKITTNWAKIEGVYYYFYLDGSMATGWVKDCGMWYYMKSNGAMATGWVCDDGTWYYMKSSGAMAIGWVNDGGVWYYMKSSGAMAIGWVNDGGVWYYMKSSGAMAIGWVNDGGVWYYMDASGAMQTGRLCVGRTWYYMDASGAMQTGWAADEGTWYYMDASGAVQTGWVNVGSDWYYMNPRGAMQTGWISFNKIWYYLGADGKMYTGFHYIDGILYQFNDSGARVA